MSHYINALQNTLKTKLIGALMGPVRESQAYDERKFTHMLVFDWQVANGSELVHPLPFGMFAEISPENASVSRLRVQVAPGYFANAPVFNEVCSKQQGISEYICSATVCRKVVAIDAVLETGSTIWSCSIEPIDEVHGLRTTVKNPVLAVQAGSDWSEPLNQYLSTTTELVTAFVTPTVAVAGDVATYIYTVPVKCGWWLKRTETFSVSAIARDFRTNDRYYWPAILREVEFMDWQRRATADQENNGYDSAVDIFPRLYFNPEAYDGPTQTRVEISWSLTPQTVTELNPMRPDRLIYGAPFYNLNCPECLHPAWVLQCDIGSNDPNYLPNVGSGRTVPETNYVEWPDEIVGFDEQIPFKGGYLRTKKTFFPPEHLSGDAAHTPEWNSDIDPTVPSVQMEAPENITDVTFDVRANTDAAYTIGCTFKIATNSSFTNGVRYFRGIADGFDFIATITDCLPEGTYYATATFQYLAERYDEADNVIGYVSKFTPYATPVQVTTTA
jgi:hypothetical protein